MRLFALLLFGCLGFLSAQTVVQKSINSEEEYFIQILADQCFRVDLSTTNSLEVVVEARIEGEYQEDLWVPIKQEGSTLTISTSFNPLFKHPNDKLSAHKVVAIALKISVPEGQRVQLLGTIADVKIEGHYRDLDVQLSTGTCTLDIQGDKVSVKTQKGDIVLLNNTGSGEVESRFGQVIGQLDNSYSCRYSLHSIEGDIRLQSLKE